VEIEDVDAKDGKARWKIVRRIQDVKGEIISDLTLISNVEDVFGMRLAADGRLVCAVAEGFILAETEVSVFPNNLNNSLFL